MIQYYFNLISCFPKMYFANLFLIYLNKDVIIQVKQKIFNFSLYLLNMVKEYSFQLQSVSIPLLTSLFYLNFLDLIERVFIPFLEVNFIQL